MSSKDLQQSPSVGGGIKPAAPQQWFISEIQQMMHGLGDCKKPLHESAVLVEEITQQQMAALMLKAADVATMRGSKLIGAEDILFLLRKDKVKLRRLLRYMDKKDQKAAAVRSASVEEDQDASSVDAGLGDSKSQPHGKRRKICYDFLSSIDQTGELLDLFDDEEEDDVKYERLLRAELRSRCLDHSQYLEFSEARQANFGRRYKSQRFRDWLTTGVNLELKPNIPALEMMSYMAYETVAQIVDLALLVKQDMQNAMADPVRAMVPSVAYGWSDAANTTSNTQQATGHKFPGLTSPTQSPPSTPVSGQTTPTAGTTPSGVSQMMAAANSKSKSKKKKKPPLPVSVESPLNITILPSDIQEAMRRYTQFIGPFASEMKVNTLTSTKMQLLSC